MSDKELTYEDAIKRIEEIVAILDKNESPLDESVKLFEEGTHLTSFCLEKLKSAEQKITVLNENENEE